MDRRNIILGAIAGVLILVAIVYAATRKGAGADLPTEFKANCVCLACRQQVRIESRVVDRSPYECPKCGKRAVYPMFVCRDCGKYGVPKLARREGDEFPSIPMVPSCSACGSQNVGGYTGTDIIPAEELALPDWP
jgi:predicted RNA-binding Zn-ribbon protein involved in translation (DUF1610 family)